MARPWPRRLWLASPALPRKSWGLDELARRALARALAGIGPNENIADIVDQPVVIGQNQRCCIHFHNDRRPLDPVAGFELATVVNRRLAPAVANIDPGPLRRRGLRIGAAAPQIGSDEGLLRPEHHGAKSDELVAGVEREGKELFVHAVEARRDASKPV